MNRPSSASLVTCKFCGHLVASDALACPGCGSPVLNEKEIETNLQETLVENVAKNSFLGKEEESMLREAESKYNQYKKNCFKAIRNSSIIFIILFGVCGLIGLSTMGSFILIFAVRNLYVFFPTRHRFEVETMYPVYESILKSSLKNNPSTIKCPRCRHSCKASSQKCPSCALPFSKLLPQTEMDK